MTQKTVKDTNTTTATFIETYCCYTIHELFVDNVYLMRSSSFNNNEYVTEVPRKFLHVRWFGTKLLDTVVLP